MANKNKDRKSKVAHTKDQAREKTTKKHMASSVSGWESDMEEGRTGRRRQTKRGGRHCPNC